MYGLAAGPHRLLRPHRRSGFRRTAGANGTVTAKLPGAPGKIVYICMLTASVTTASAGSNIRVTVIRAACGLNRRGIRRLVRVQQMPRLAGSVICSNARNQRSHCSIVVAAPG